MVELLPSAAEEFGDRRLANRPEWTVVALVCADPAQVGELAP